MSWKMLVHVFGVCSLFGGWGCAASGAPECDDEASCEEAGGDAGADHTGDGDDGDGDDGDGGGGGSAGGPVIEVLATSIRDERQDVIEFAPSGGPRSFEHTGNQIELGGEGCPVVHKHAFLLRPDHGADESPANPLELRFRVAADPDLGVDPAGGAFRARAQGAGEYLTDWLPLVGSPEGTDALVYTAGLDRDVVPELVEVGGPIEVEMRGRDRSGREATELRCIDLRPIAGPLAVTQPEAMPRFSLMYDDPIAPILNGQGAWPLIRLEVANGTPDPVYARLDRSAVSGTCTKKWQKWRVLGSIQTGTQTCESDVTVCRPPDFEDEVDHDLAVACSPTLASSSSRFDLRVVVNGTVTAECAGCQADQYRLPPRSTAVVSLVAVDVPGLQPRENSEPEETYSDQEVLYRTATSGAGFCPGSTDCRSMRITGRVELESGCMKTTLINGELFCSERRTYKLVRALTSVNAIFDDLSIDVTSVSLRPGDRQEPPTGYGSPRVFGGYLWSTNESSSVPDA